MKYEAIIISIPRGTIPCFSRRRLPRILPPKPHARPPSNLTPTRPFHAHHCSYPPFTSSSPHHAQHSATRCSSSPTPFASPILPNANYSQTYPSTLFPIYPLRCAQHPLSAFSFSTSHAPQRQRRDSPSILDYAYNSPLPMALATPTTRMPQRKYSSPRPFALSVCLPPLPPHTKAPTCLGHNPRIITLRSPSPPPPPRPSLPEEALSEKEEEKM